MTDRELLAVVSAILFMGEHDTAVAAVRRAADVLKNVDGYIAANPSGSTLLTTPGVPKSMVQEAAAEGFPAKADVPHTATIPDEPAKGKRAK